jgi:ParB family chromosome partitioning protein
MSAASQTPPEIRMIPVDLIEVMNPRDRNNKVFAEISKNIKTIGLKKPVTVTPRQRDDGSAYFLLICGEGRLKAVRTLGADVIPAVVAHVTDEDAFIMSLAENIARRQGRPLELLASINQLSKKGYTAKDIAAKTGLTLKYVQGMVTLLQNGEERLIVAVEMGTIPLNAALAIVGAKDDDAAIQTALQDAYESGALKGKRLLDARRVIEKRKALGGSSSRNRIRTHARDKVTSTSLVRTYQMEVERQKLLVKKSEFAQQRLLFVTSAFAELLADENFVNLLRAEGLESMPKYLADRVRSSGRSK